MLRQTNELDTFWRSRLTIQVLTTPWHSRPAIGSLLLPMLRGIIFPLFRLSGASATAGLPSSAIPEPRSLLMLLTAAIFGMAQSARRPQLDIFKERYDVAVKP